MRKEAGDCEGKTHERQGETKTLGETAVGLRKF